METAVENDFDDGACNGGCNDAGIPEEYWCRECTELVGKDPRWIAMKMEAAARREREAKQKARKEAEFRRTPRRPIPKMTPEMLAKGLNIWLGGFAERNNALKMEIVNPLEIGAALHPED